MNELYNSLSNRDLSIIFWFSIFILFFLLVDLKNTKQLLILLFNKYFLILYLIVILYFGCIINFLTKQDLWNLSYYKELIFWFITSGVALFLKIDKLNRFKDFLQVILEILTINTILEYLINLDSFSLITELILIPLICFITLTYQISIYKKSTDSKYKLVSNFLHTILATLGFIILGITLYKIVNDFNRYFTFENLRTFTIAPFLTLIYLPILYFIVVFMKYENSFMILDRYKFLGKKRDKIKISFLLISNFNLRKIDNMKEMIVWNKRQLRDEQNIFYFIKKNINNIEKNYDE